VRQGNTLAPSCRRCSVPEEPRYFAKIGRQNGGVQIEERFEEMAKGTFGERLKRERELREVTIKEIASATRIAAKFLQALENEEWEKLPGGVFGRGFVRSVARYLGLSEENLLSDYDQARGEALLLLRKNPKSEFLRLLNGFLPSLWYCWLQSLSVWHLEDVTPGGGMLLIAPQKKLPRWSVFLLPMWRRKIFSRIARLRRPRKTKHRFRWTSRSRRLRQHA